VAMASTGPLAAPTSNVDYPVYAFGYRLEGGISLRDQILKSQRVKEGEQSLPPRATAVASVVIHQER